MRPVAVVEVQPRDIHSEGTVAVCADFVLIVVGGELVFDQKYIPKPKLINTRVRSVLSILPLCRISSISASAAAAQPVKISAALRRFSFCFSGLSPDNIRTVKENSAITGISVRTLHYYNQIGLLRPTEKNEAGNRRQFLIRISAFIPDHVQKILMYPRIITQLGMKGRDQLISLPGGHNIPVHHGQHLR